MVTRNYHDSYGRIPVILQENKMDWKRLVTDLECAKKQGVTDNEFLALHAALTYARQHVKPDLPTKEDGEYGVSRGWWAITTGPTADGRFRNLLEAIADDKVEIRWKDGGC